MDWIVAEPRKPIGMWRRSWKVQRKNSHCVVVVVVEPFGGGTGKAPLLFLSKKKSKRRFSSVAIVTHQGLFRSDSK